MTEKTLFVPDISCDHCKMSIEHTVRGLGGVDAVSVDIPERMVALSFDEAEITLQKIIAAMAEIGYEVPAVE